METTYIQAVTALINDEQSVDSVLANLQSVLKRRGHERLYARVLAGVVKQLEQQSINNALKVTVAKESDVESNSVRALVKKLEAENASVITNIDETLIGGVKVVYQHRQIDHTFKTALRQIYERVTI